MELQSQSSPSLVVLAAGAGHRYGGLKQLEHVGPDGTTLIDYTAFNAWREGFKRIVFVIRRESEQAFREQFEPRLGAQMAVRFCFQEPHPVSTESVRSTHRKRRWGTAHAVLAAASETKGPFAVANGDDLYASTSFAAIRAFCDQAIESTVPTYGLVGYDLIDTLSREGAVSRALCRCHGDSELIDIEEIHGIERYGSKGRCSSEDGRSQILDGRIPVSMNLWAFDPTIHELLSAEYNRWCQSLGTKRDDEFGLPTAIRKLVQQGSVRVRVLRGGGQWCGLTHRQDKEHVVERVQAMVTAGIYPRKLWC